MSPEDNSEVPFTINSKTGIISTTAALDRELVSRYDLVVQAVDGDKANRQLSTTHVLVQVVDVNDNPPVFSQDSYVTTISERYVFYGYAKSTQIECLSSALINTHTHTCEIKVTFAEIIRSHFFVTCIFFKVLLLVNLSLI